MIRAAGRVAFISDLRVCHGGRYTCYCIVEKILQRGLRACQFLHWVRIADLGLAHVINRVRAELYAVSLHVAKFGYRFECLNSDVGQRRYWVDMSHK